MDKEGTQTNGPKDKEIDNNFQDLTLARWYGVYVSGKEEECRIIITHLRKASSWQTKIKQVVAQCSPYNAKLKLFYIIKYYHLLTSSQ